jgi:hypothetical protein
MDAAFLRLNDLQAMEGIAKRLAAYNPSRFVYHETVKPDPPLDSSF